MITIIVPCKNRLDKLEECLNSIIIATNKANDNFKDLKAEIIVVNDHSDEGFSNKLREKFKDITIIESDGIGPGYARNIGIKNSKGEYIFFTDSDCVVDESWILEGYKVFKEKNAIAIQGVPWLFQKNVNYKLGKNEEDLYKLMFSTYITGEFCKMTDSRNLLINRNIVDKLGDTVFSEKSSKATAESRVFGKKCVENDIDIFFGNSIKVYHEDSRDMISVCKQKYRHGMGRVEIWSEKPDYKYLSERYFDNPIRNGIDQEYVLKAHFAFLYGYYSNINDEKEYHKFISFINEIYKKYDEDMEKYKEIMEFI